MLRIFATALFVLLVFHQNANAQQALVVDTCGVLPTTLDVGPAKQVYQDKNGLQCMTPAVAAGSPPPYTLAPSTSPTNALSHASTTTLGTSLLANNSAGNLYAYHCDAITGGSQGYCIAYNNATVPSTGALTGSKVLDFCTFTAMQPWCALSRIPMSVNYGSGIVILISTAADPYTYTTGVATGAITVDYK